MQDLHKMCKKTTELNVKHCICIGLNKCFFDGKDNQYKYKYNYDTYQDRQESNLPNIAKIYFFILRLCSYICGMMLTANF